MAREAWSSLLLFPAGLAAAWGVAGFAWVNRDRWLVRWLAVEGAFLAVFTQWYISRYYQWGGQLPFGGMIVLIVIVAALILVGGWWRDRKGN
jgi:hypothetical protein